MNKVLIYGGLGNQMSQYALNLALHQKGNKSKILFSGFFYHWHHNGFNLSYAFKIKLPFPLNFYNFLLLHGEFLYKNKIVARSLKKTITWYHKKRYITYTEKEEFVYDENVLQQTSALLIGTWQVEAYFKNIEDIIRREFIFNMPKDTKNKELIKEVTTCNSVSIHIRRGDYLNPKYANSHIVIKDQTYYVNSINYLNKKVHDPHYFVFSDDIDWVKENFKISNCTFVNHNKGRNAYIDMYLMSLCKHNIIANSTFSWWAAWLNKYEHKIVTIPERWLNTKNCAGIYPSDWIKIKV